MRSVLLIFATLVLLAGGFFAYLWFQPTGGGSSSGGGGAPTTVPVAIAPASRPTEMPDPNVIGGGGTSVNIYIKTTDEKTGQISNEFRAARMEPRKDGTLEVTEPEAKFYLSKTDAGQVLVIRGKSGKVQVPDSAKKRPGQMKSMDTAAPTRGQLQDVTVLVFDEPDAPEPTLTCTMNNASFDQETFRIQTESYEHNGKIIPADQVPVQVRGKDYDFDGRGLDIRWNERDRRLQQLEIAHGEKLVVKHPQAIKSLTGASTQPSAMLVEGSALASGAPESAGEAMVAAPVSKNPRKKRKPPTAPAVAPVKIVRDKSAALFRATFNDNVKIVEGDATLATANRMLVDFMMESATSTTQPTTQATSTTKSAAVRSASTEPKSLANASRAARNKSATTAPAETKQSSMTVGNPLPTTQPQEQPITLFWSGKLSVMPIPADSNEEELPTKEDAIVTLEGEPVVLTRTGGHVDAALVRFHTQDSSLLLDHSERTPMVVMRDENGSVLRTPSFFYDGTSGIAELSDASSADVIVKPESTTQPAAEPTVMHASWTELCRLYLAGAAQESMSIDRAEITGDVNVDHPQVKGRSDALTLNFQRIEGITPTTKPTNGFDLKDLDANGNVHYVLTNEQKTQTIDAGHLNLITARDAAKKTYPKSMTADGGVHAFDDQQDLKSGTLLVKMRPSTKPSTAPANQQKVQTAAVDVESVEAKQNVQISSKDGNSAHADVLTMSTIDGKRKVTLTGAPAVVQQKDNRLAGAEISFDPDSNLAAVVGAGSMHAVQIEAAEPTSKSAKPDKKPQPIDMNWAGGLTADGNSNLINITDKIAIAAKTDDGAINTATSEKLTLTLADDPKAATRPTTKKAKDDSPLAKAGFGDSNFFKDKLVRTLQLKENVQIASVLNDEAGKLLRRLYMRSATVEYHMQDKIFLVPAPGQMLMQDVSKPATTQPLATAVADPTASDMHGATAIEWKRELRYDETKRRITLDGGAYVVHESGGDNKPFSLRCQTIIADLEPAPTTQPATKPATTEPTEEKMRLKHVVAQRQVEFTSLPMHFIADSIDYDPNTHILIARGTDRERAELYDEKGSLQGSFTQIRYNLQTGRIENMVGFRSTVRR